jgi:hypothetical protein
MQLTLNLPSKRIETPKGCGAALLCTRAVGLLADLAGSTDPQNGSREPEQLHTACVPSLAPHAPAYRLKDGARRTSQRLPWFSQGAARKA